MQRSAARSKEVDILGIVVCVGAVAALAWAAYLDHFSAGAWRHWLGWGLTLSPAAVVWFLSIQTRQRWVRRIGYGTLAVAVILVLVPWNARKLFVWHLHSVNVGMTIDEVEAEMDGYTKGRGAKWAMPEGPPPTVRRPGDEEDLDAKARAEAAHAAYRPPDYPGGEDRRRATGTMTYRWNTTDAAYDADWGQVTFQDGRVVGVEFLPD